MSKSIKGKDAHELGLVDALASANELVSSACSLALEIVERKRPWIKSLYRTDKLPTLGDTMEILKTARVQAQKQAANVQHPIVCIDVIEEGIVSDPRAGLMKVNHQLVLPFLNTSSDVRRILIYIHFLTGSSIWKMLEESLTSKSLRHVFSPSVLLQRLVKRRG